LLGCLINTCLQVSHQRKPELVFVAASSSLFNDYKLYPVCVVTFGLAVPLPDRIYLSSSAERFPSVDDCSMPIRANVTNADCNGKLPIATLPNVIIIIIIIILRHPGPFRAFAFVQLKSWWRMGSIYLF
jgi:hypothetical protein